MPRLHYATFRAIYYGVEARKAGKTMTMSPIESLMAERTAKRMAVASSRARAALNALKKAGISAWVVGSLARHNFRVHSDVDFLVDCDRNSEHVAFRIIEREMGDFPFHFVLAPDLDDTTRLNMVKEAADASGICAYAHPTG